MRVAGALILTLLSACATPLSQRPLLSAESQQTLLRELERFSLRGSASIRPTDADGFQASLSWNQRAEESSLRLSGSLGVGSLNVTWRPGALRLAASRGEVYENAEAEQVLIDELGFIPPFEALRYWVLGLEAPGEAPTGRTLAESGHIEELEQQQWLIRYERWSRVAVRGGAIELPRRIRATHEGLRLTIAINKWEL